MATGVQVWSTTAASNNTADSAVNWSEGQAPSTVNDSARAEMASVAKWRDDNNGTIATTGTTAAYTITTSQISTANIDGYTVAVKFHATNDATATLARDTAPAAVLQVVAGTNVVGGEFAANTIHEFTYSSGSTAWIRHGGNVNTSNISNSAVTLAKIANIATNTLLGNTIGSDGAPEAIAIGTGLSVASATSTAPTLSAPAFPPTAAFKNLSIKVTGTSSAALVADFVTLATSGSSQFITIPTSGAINFGTNAAKNALDAGSLASGTWYAIWAIGTSTSTIADALASTSFTTPLLPAGYIYKARLGAVVTSTSTASAQLMGTWQFNRDAAYVVGLGATTTALMQIFSATNTAFTAQSVSKFVPSTASAIKFRATNGSNVANWAIAPNSSYSASAPSDAQFAVNNAVASTAFVSGTMTLEGTNIFQYSNTGTMTAICYGWEDNI